METKMFRVSAYYHNGQGEYDETINPVYIQASSVEDAGRWLIDNHRLVDLPFWTIEVTPVSFGETVEFSAFSL